MNLDQACRNPAGRGEVRYEVQSAVHPSKINTKRLLFELAKHVPVALVAYNTEVEVMGRRAKCRLPNLLVHTEESKAALSGKPRATITHEMPPLALVTEVVSPGAANCARDYRYKRTE